MRVLRSGGAALALSVPILCGAACGGEDASDDERPPWCLPGPPSVEVGSGSSAFEPIEPGGSVPIIFGPQGGAHITISGRTRGLGPSALVEYGANDADSGELLTWLGLRQVVPLKEGPEGGEIHGLIGFLSEPSPVANAGRGAVLWLTVTDDCSPPLTGAALATLTYENP